MKKKRKILFQFILYIGRRKGLINFIEYSYRSKVKLTAFFFLSFGFEHPQKRGKKSEERGNSSFCLDSGAKKNSNKFRGHIIEDTT